MPEAVFGFILHRRQAGGADQLLSLQPRQAVEDLLLAEAVHGGDGS